MTETHSSDVAVAEEAPAFPEPAVPAAGGSYINHEPTGTLTPKPEENIAPMPGEPDEPAKTAGRKGVRT